MAAYGALVLGSMLQWLGMIFVTGMNAHVAAAAAVGRRLSLGEAWGATRGKRWRLIGMTALLAALSLLIIGILVGLIVLLALTVDTLAAVLISILLGLLTLVGFVFIWIRVYYLAVPPLMLEPIGVFAALGRAWNLTRRQFWRTFGIALLTAIIANVAGGIISAPIGIVGQLVMVADPGRHRLLLVHRGQLAGHRDRLGTGVAVHHDRHLAAVHRPAHPQGGLRRRADGQGGNHRVVIGS